MNTYRQFLILISSTALLQSYASAAPRVSAPRQESTRTASRTTPDQSRDVAPGGKGEAGKTATSADGQRKPSHASDKKPSRSQPQPKIHRNSPSQIGQTRHPPVADTSANAPVNKGLPPSGAAKSTGAVPRQSGAPRTGTMQSVENVHHREANPPVISGASNKKAGNTGAINGTQMNRRP